MIEVKIYSCYKLTYSAIYKDVLKRIYGSSFDCNNVVLTIEDVSDNGKRNIQSQRSITKIAQRTIRIFENGVIKHVVGISNTNYDLDRKNEFELGISNKETHQYGVDGYHANTYLKQGINKIFKLYFENRDTADLSFYLMDTDKNRNYPNNLFNTMSYRELATIGFRILNIENINFSDYERECSSSVNKDDLAFGTFDKYVRDIAYVSRKNSGNRSSFLDAEEHRTPEGYVVDKYIYTFKVLSAQVYDSLIRCWCLKTLADKANTLIEFKLGKQYFAYSLEEPKVSDRLTGPVEELFNAAEINVQYVTQDEFLNDMRKESNVYLKHKAENNIRNQSLFRKNMRKVGTPQVCVICGEDNTRILEAAHIWEINSIRNADVIELNAFLKIDSIKDLFDLNNEHRNEVFYKKYIIANAGENGVWMCNNHHGLFDRNFFCFDSGNGKILLRFDSPVDAYEFAEKYKEVDLIRDNILTDKSRPFFIKRQMAFIA